MRAATALDLFVFAKRALWVEEPRAFTKRRNIMVCAGISWLTWFITSYSFLHFASILHILVLFLWHYCVEGNELACFDINLGTTSEGHNWELGQCSFSDTKHRTTDQLLAKYPGYVQYTEKCCLPNGDYVLLCRNNQYHGWVNSLVGIKDHKFCDDMVGYNGMIMISIPGSYIYSILIHKRIA